VVVRLYLQAPIDVDDFSLIQVLRLAICKGFQVAAFDEVDGWRSRE